MTKYLLVWFLLAIVAIATGTVRQVTYGKYVSDLIAHQVSTVTAILASGVLVWYVNCTWPIESSTQATQIGAMWLMLTIAFEFGFGHYAAGHTWAHLLADYNLLKGRVWSLFLAWVAVLPVVVFWLASCVADSTPSLGPEPCSTMWLQLVEEHVSTGDSEGHGPDLGSSEWRSVVEFKLGVRGDPIVPDRATSDWCYFVDRRLAANPVGRD
ncbi:MAG: hypothetical protein K0U72_10100 [Gammaproteobacteria bacterium]|nr:hypothetical protein [Gammaproteobacteria bacterium]